MRWGCVLIVFFLLSPLVCGEEVKRTILSFYIGSEDKSTIETPIHQYLELPLNYLGYHVKYWDIEKGLPADDVMEPVHAILTWFHDKKLEDPVAYADWLVKQLHSKKKYVFFGASNLVENAKGEATPLEKINAVFNLLGMKHFDDWVLAPDVRGYDVLSAFGEKFERQLPQEATGFYMQKATDSRAKVWVKGRFGEGESSDIILTTPQGGCAAEGHFLFFPGGAFEEREGVYAHATQWRLDPIRFLREALSVDHPIPDMTTCCGERMAFIHVDGDGWNNLSEAVKGLTSAEVVLQTLLKPNSSIPFTIGPIASDLDPLWGGEEKAQKTLEAIAALPLVEIANHTYSHPQEWGFYTVPRTLEEEKKREDLPRGSIKKPFDLKNEVLGAQHKIEKYMPPEKKIRLYLWSGDCLPYEAVFETLKEAHLLNLNGGSNRFDTEFPSLTGISPFYRQVGPHIQVYSAGSNEESYTYGWSDRFFGLKYFRKTLENTEHPYRLKPMNLYFNMYTGQKAASINAAQQVIDYMQKQNVFWTFAYDYAALVKDFPPLRIEKIANNQWKIRGRGKINTVRFDLATDRSIDLVKSIGIIGVKHYQGSLYLTLDPAKEEVEIFSETSELMTGPQKANQPYLLDSTWQIFDFQSESDETSMSVEGAGEGRIHIILPQKTKYLVYWGKKKLGEDQISIENNIMEIRFSSQKTEKNRLKLVAGE